ncbi:hypothetical protein [Roseococcus pinisoli]|uniref:Uncharacterized protein n=1 Tax=Roseococcus pinisoli TaxID=2835040 RepID=A0ABS5Q7H5_9PROT|nr:hypothetical protein [Roseococcus pinisoli]MBS7809413.1 hypothetical protein [Roseococcus pinisoli]
MRLNKSGPKVLLLLGLGAALSGCSSLESGFASTTGWMSDRYGPSWGGMRPAVPADSLTVQRIQNRGEAAALPPLTTEPGDVWPREEGPRATLANPDEALRGLRPSEDTPPPRRRGSAAPADPVVTGVPPMRAFDAPPPAPPRAARTDTPRNQGQVIFTPQGPVNTTGGTDRVQSTISPQGPGVAIRDGNMTTIIGPGGDVQQVPTPR